MGPSIGEIPHHIMGDGMIHRSILFDGIPLALKTTCNSLENRGFIVDLPVENSDVPDVPSFFGCLPEGI